jgi:hypothetical protein
MLLYVHMYVFKIMYDVWPHVVSRVKCILQLYMSCHVCMYTTPQTVLLYSVQYLYMYIRLCIHVVWYTRVHIQIVHVPVVKNSYL